MRSETLPRREREKLRRRQEILAAACELFSVKGYHRVTMGEISEKAELAIGTLYKFFRDKEDLYKALVLEQCEQLENALDRAIEGPEDGIEKLRSYVRITGERLGGNLPFVRVFLAESTGASFNVKSGLDKELRRRRYAFLERLASVFEVEMKKKRLGNIAPPFYLAVALAGVLDAFLLLQLDVPEQHPYPEDPDAILDIFFHGLVSSDPCEGSYHSILP